MTKTKQTTHTPGPWKMEVTPNQFSKSRYHAMICGNYDDNEEDERFKGCEDCGSQRLCMWDALPEHIDQVGMWVGDGARLYVTKNCNKVFKPQIGDLIQWTIHKNKKHALEQTFIKEATKDIIAAVWHKENEFYVDDKKIIQRNNRVFFTPKIEE